MTAPLLHALADELAGRIVYTDDGNRLALPGGGVIYENFRGHVKLERYGRPVVALGGHSDGVAVIVAAYRAAVGVEVGAA